MQEPQAAVTARVLTRPRLKTDHHGMLASRPLGLHNVPHLTSFALTALLVQLLAQLVFMQPPSTTAPFQIGPLGYTIDAYIPPRNGNKYFVTNYYHFTIDVSHFESGLERARDIFRDIDRGHSITVVRDQLRALPAVGALGYTSEYAISKHPTTRVERERIALGIFLHSQRTFERWQGAGWLSPGNEWWRGSSYANEDLPSDYLGFYAAARYPHLSAENALTAIAYQLGGGVWSNKEPPHAGMLGYSNPTTANGNVAFPLHWGDLRLKNPTSTPRVPGEHGWYNVAWPAGLSITPLGQETYWRYLSSYNTRNGQRWFW